MVLLEHIGEGDITSLRDLSDKLREKRQKLAYVIAASQEGKLHVILGMSRDLEKSSLDMKVLFDRLSRLLGTSGGGRRDLVQGGGPDQGQFAKELGQIEQIIASYIEEQGL